MTAPTENFYLLDDFQSAELETYRFALRALDSLSSDGSLSDPDSIEIDRVHMGALFTLLADRLDDIVGDALPSAWLPSAAAPTSGQARSRRRRPAPGATAAAN